MRRAAGPALVRVVTAALRVLALLVGLLGLVVNGGIALALATAVGIVAGLCALVPPDRPERGREARRRLWRLTVTGLVAAPVVAGLIVLIGSATGPLVLLAVLAAVHHARLGRWPTRSGADPDGDQQTDDLTGLSDTELGRAWRRSHARLARVSDGRQLDRVCALRRRQLDEMERRHPHAFRRWLGSGGGVTGSTAPFLER